MKFHFLNVGQASSIVIDFDNGVYGVVDCGGVRGENEAPVVAFLQDAREKHPKMRIAFLVITHLDLDHVNAFSLLVDDSDLAGRIEHLYCNELAYRRTFIAARRAIQPSMGVTTNKRNHLKSLRLLGELGNFIRKNSMVGRDFHFDCVSPECSRPSIYPVELSVDCGDPGIRFLLWAPSQRLKDESLRKIDFDVPELLDELLGNGEVEDWNSGSIVLTIDIKGVRFLLAGDATAKTWQEILRRIGEDPLGADVALAWHHGGKLGSRDGINLDTLAWDRVLTRTRRIVVISCGSKNSYGHPHPDTVKNILRLGGEIYCTERKIRKARAKGAEGRVDMIFTHLHGIAKEIWYEQAEEVCCGDVTIEATDVGQVRILCSSGECTARNLNRDCCFGAPVLQTSLSF